MTDDEEREADDLINAVVKKLSVFGKDMATETELSGVVFCCALGRLAAQLIARNLPPEAFGEWLSAVVEDFSNATGRPCSLMHLVESTETKKEHLN